MSAASTVLAGRAATEALMVDSCLIDRPTGEALDEVTGLMVTTFDPVYPTLSDTFADIYTDTYGTWQPGKCRVQDTARLGSNPNAGEHQFTLLGLVIQLPLDATVYRIGDRVRLTDSVLDPTLVGVVATVTSLMHKTHATARRLVCEEVSA